MRRTQKQTQYIRMTKDRLNPMPRAVRQLLDERDALQARLAIVMADRSYVALAAALAKHHAPLHGSGLCDICALDAAGGA